jgi:hypothetical protein
LQQDEARAKKPHARETQEMVRVRAAAVQIPARFFQLIDNLNASIHLRALLTDLFLLGEILRKQNKPAAVVTSDGD